MALEIHRGEKPAGGIVSDRRLCLTADKELVVEADDPRAAFLFATEGFEVSAGDVERYGLSLDDGRVGLPGANASNEGDEAGSGDASDEEKEAGEDAGGDGGAPEWPLKTPPEEYLERSPDGPKAELARQILAARAQDGTGDA